MGAVNSISATQSGQYLASAGHDGHVYFWNVASGMDYSINGRNTGLIHSWKLCTGGNEASRDNFELDILSRKLYQICIFAP